MSHWFLHCGFTVAVTSNPLRPNPHHATHCVPVDYCPPPPPLLPPDTVPCCPTNLPIDPLPGPYAVCGQAPGTAPTWTSLWRIAACWGMGRQMACWSPPRGIATWITLRTRSRQYPKQTHYQDSRLQAGRAADLPVPSPEAPSRCPLGVPACMGPCGMSTSHVSARHAAPQGHPEAVATFTNSSHTEISFYIRVCAACSSVAMPSDATHVGGPSCRIRFLADVGSAEQVVLSLAVPFVFGNVGLKIISSQKLPFSASYATSAWRVLCVQQKKLAKPLPSYTPFCSYTYLLLFAHVMRRACKCSGLLRIPWRQWAPFDRCVRPCPGLIWAPSTCTRPDS